MTKKIVDARGQLCPKPLIMTKKALQELGPHEHLAVLIDNQTSKENVERFLKDNGVIFRTEDLGAYFQIMLSAGAPLPDLPQPEAYCRPAEKAQAKSRHVVCLGSDRMGIGADELGGILLRAFINTLHETSPLPEGMVFYNTGIKLTLDDSPVLEALQNLEKAGIKMLVCGTCVDYFKAKEKVSVGTVSNMYDISQTLARAAHVVAP